jgi:alkylhydroperoxidase/carboxymuconolactone decarboxylase family protein YurZ
MSSSISDAAGRPGAPVARAAALALVERIDPDFAVVARRAYAAAEERELTGREAALVGMVVHGNISYYDPVQMEGCVRAALEAGADVLELAKVIELTAVMGYHGVAVTVPITLEALQSQGRLPGPGAAPRDTLRNISRSMVAEWAGAAGQMADFARVSPELADLMSDWTRVAWNNDILDRKLKELIYLAFDATPTHIFLPGVAGHVHRCLDAGATVREIMQVLEISVTPAMDVVGRSLHLLAEVTAASRNPPRS